MTKKNVVSLVLIAIAILALSFIVCDWRTLFQCQGVQGCIEAHSHYQHISKFSVTLLSCFLVLFIGRDSVTPKDRLLLSCAFAATLCADFCLKILHNWPGLLPFKINYTMAGIAFFIVVQTFLIFRHSRRPGAFHFPKIFLVSLAGLAVSIVMFILNPEGSAMKEVVIAYACFLIPSVIVAWKAPATGFYPHRNAMEIRIGMIFFLLCDINVGLSLSNLPVNAIANNMVWFFYTPALVLLALSGYRRAE